MCKLDLFEVGFEILRLEHYETAMFFYEIIKVSPLADQIKITISYGSLFEKSERLEINFAPLHSTVYHGLCAESNRLSTDVRFGYKALSK